MASWVMRETESERTQAADKIEPTATRDPVMSTPVRRPR